MPLSPLSALCLAGTTLWFLAGCHQFPRASASARSGKKGELAVPGKWTAPAAISAQAVDGWVPRLGSGSLTSLVRQALAENPNLKQAAARMQGARWRSVQQGAERFPDLAARLGGGTDISKIAPALAEWQSSTKYDLALNFSWELDVWGRLRSQAASAKLEADAAEADFQAARLSLAANTVKAWGNLVETTQLAALADRTVENFEKSLASLEAKVTRGVPGVTALDEKLSRASLASALSQAAATQRRQDAARRTLEAILGSYPAGKISSETKLPTISATIPAGLPSQLLLRRPDVRAAEFRVAAAVAEADAAWKQLLPGIRLTGSGGTSSSQLAELLDPKLLTANLASSLAQPIFNAGRLKAGAKLAESDRDALAAGYAETSLQAFREVETALAAEVYLRNQVQALREYARHSSEAESMALENYDKAQVTFVTVLEAQRRAVDSQEALIQAENALLQNRADLHLAIGGDWE